MSERETCRHDSEVISKVWCSGRRRSAPKDYRHSAIQVREQDIVVIMWWWALSITVYAGGAAQSQRSNFGVKSWCRAAGEKAQGVQVPAHRAK